MLAPAAETIQYGKLPGELTVYPFIEVRESWIRRIQSGSRAVAAELNLGYQRIEGSVMFERCCPVINEDKC